MLPKSLANENRMHLCGKSVVVPKAQLPHGHGVVLIHDRNHVVRKEL
jgi:hypothetical protein